MSVPEAIRTTRVQRGFLQKELARKVGVSRHKVMAWENAARQPDADELRLVADALGVSVGFLFGESED